MILLTPLILAPKTEPMTRAETETPAAPVSFVAKQHPRQKRDPRTQWISGQERPTRQQQHPRQEWHPTPAAPMKRVANETPGVPVTLDVRTTPMVRTKPRTRGACETLGKPGKE